MQAVYWHVYFNVGHSWNYISDKSSPYKHTFVPINIWVENVIIIWHLCVLAMERIRSVIHSPFWAFIITTITFSYLKFWFLLLICSEDGYAWVGQVFCQKS